MLFLVKTLGDDVYRAKDTIDGRSKIISYVLA